MIAVVLMFFWWTQKKTTPTPAPYQQVESGIQSDSDLTAITNDLDSTDVDSFVDGELSQNDTDATSF